MGSLIEDGEGGWLKVELDLLRKIIKDISEAPDMDSALRMLLRRVCEASGWAYGDVWVPSSDHSSLVSGSAWYAIHASLDEFRKTGEGFIFRPGSGLPGLAWSSKKPVLVSDLTVILDSPRIPFALEAGFKSGVAIPVPAGNDIFVIANFFAFESGDVDEQLVSLVSSVVSRIGPLLKGKGLEAALRESENRYALATRGTNDGLWDWRPAANEIYFSRRWKEMLGCGDDEIGNNPDEWFSRVYPEDRERLRAALGAHLKGCVECAFESEYRMRHKDGDYRWMLCRGMAVSAGRAVRMAGFQSDITDRKRKEQQLTHDALHDALSGLPNRVLFSSRLGHLIDRAKRSGEYGFAVIFLDLDFFKTVNDNLGHNAGDALLVSVARRFESCIRPGDTIARIGGDEFAVLLEDVKDMNEVTIVADRLQEALKAPFEAQGREIFVTASMGISLGEKKHMTPECILSEADTAMYRAKANGKACYETSRHDSRGGLTSARRIEIDLQKALERDEFIVYYQPIVSLENGEITGAEALLRWRHPARGFIPPVEFISIAEDAGLLGAIGEWVLRTACRQNMNWHNAGFRQMRMSVNISGRQFKNRMLPEMVRGVLDESGMPASYLGVEVTENVAMENIDFSIMALGELRSMGVAVSIDDFGTGYSSLPYLKRFPVSSLKIDRSFVRDIPSSPDDMAIAATIVAMAHSLDLTVIAEGVEFEEQRDFLKGHNCDEMQGYLFSRPLPADGITALLQAGRC